ncbi:MAG: hypothetical protein ACON5B_12340 [Myxococcota bacterium]
MTTLNEPYLSWFKAVVGRPPPPERSATCHDCPMCAARDFHPVLKCCTYIPALTNAAVGKVLTRGGEGARRVRHQLDKGLGNGRWLQPSPHAEATYDRVHDQFGATRELRCPYVTEAGACSIWEDRNAICATWFCQHDAGEQGAAMWDAAADLFHFAEGGLAVLCEADTYEAAATASSTVTWTDLQAVGGEQLRRLEDALRDAASQLGMHPVTTNVGDMPCDHGEATADGQHCTDELE